MPPMLPYRSQTSSSHSVSSCCRDDIVSHWCIWAVQWFPPSLPLSQTMSTMFTCTLFDWCSLMLVLLTLQARSQEARSNWETALESKDRAIEQLEEALASRQRALVSIPYGGGRSKASQIHQQIRCQAQSPAASCC